MARITVEDCLEFVPNRFELVLLSAQRARELGVGAKPTVPWDKDKPGLVALREIASGKVEPAELREALVRSLQKYADQESLPEEEVDSFSLGEIVVGAPGHDAPGRSRL